MNLDNSIVAITATLDKDAMEIVNQIIEEDGVIESKAVAIMLYDFFRKGGNFPPGKSAVIALGDFGGTTDMGKALHIGKVFHMFLQRPTH